MTKRFTEGFKHKLFIYSLLAVAFGLPILVPQWHSILLAIFVIAWIPTIKSRDFFEQIKSAKVMFLVFFGVFIINVFGLLYSDNVNYGLVYVERMVPFIIFPVILFSSQLQISTIDLKNVIIAFIAGVLTLNLSSLALIAYDLWDPKRLEASLTIANNNIVDIHPIFLSLYISFCIFFITECYLPLQGASRNRLGWVLFSSVILLVYIVWLNSRVGILSFVIASIFYLFYKLKRGGRIYGFMILGVFILVLLMMPFSRNRFLEGPLMLIQETAKLDQKNFLTRNFYYREGILDCSLDLVKGPEVLYGYGTGDFNDVLQDCYSRKNYSWLKEDDLDSQCEYFAQVHRQGLMALSLFLALMIVPLYYAFKYKNPMYAAFVILFGITALFENVLSSQKGVTFLALFSPILYLLARKKWEDKVGPSNLN